MQKNVKYSIIALVHIISLSCCALPYKNLLIIGPHHELREIEALDNDALLRYLQQEYKYMTIDRPNFLDHTDDENHYAFLLYTYPLTVKDVPDGRYFKDVGNFFIKIAYSQIETTALPEGWADLLNTYFDMVMVPHLSLIDVYKNSGVTIPIFCLPHGIEVKQYKKDSIQKPHVPFTFGCVARNFPYKNLMKLLNAFYAEFNGNAQVQLKINAKNNCHFNDSIENFIFENNPTNIVVTEKNMNTEERLAFMNECDCYMMISRGEGFSPTVYEAMALGIPCIVSNNSAHTTLCNADLVHSVACPLEEEGFIFYLFEYAGHDFDCHQEDVQKAMREVYEKYQEAQVCTQKAMEYAACYEWEHVITQYKTIFSPERVVMGSYNAVEGTTLVTTSKRLALKYMIQKICSMGVKKLTDPMLLFLNERRPEILNFYVTTLEMLLMKEIANEIHCLKNYIVETYKESIPIFHTYKKMEKIVKKAIDEFHPKVNKNSLVNKWVHLYPNFDIEKEIFALENDDFFENLRIVESILLNIIFNNQQHYSIFEKKYIKTQEDRTFFDLILFKTGMLELS